jgi:hypothetical protein
MELITMYISILYLDKIIDIVSIFQTYPEQFNYSRKKESFNEI